MKTYPMPAQFDGDKFADRYHLNTLQGDFFSDGTLLHVPDNLPDDPPIFEGPNAISLMPVVDWSAAGTSFPAKAPAGYTTIRVGKVIRYTPYWV